MDAVILAGGFGTRIRNLWPHPKCLVPVLGKPILGHLLDKLQLQLNIHTLVLSLGYQHTEVLKWFFQNGYNGWERRTVVTVDVEPIGTAAALRRAAPTLTAPVLVLNGDTLPFYDLREVTSLYEDRLESLRHKRPSKALDSVVGVDGMSTHVGCCLLGPKTLHKIIEEKGTRMLDEYLYDMGYAHCENGFLDIGTVRGFDSIRKLKSLTGEYE